MKRELIVINVVLVLLLAGIAFELRQGWLDFKANHHVSLITFEGEALGTPDVPPETGAPTQDWTAIGDQNLFSVDRNDLNIESPTDSGPVGPRPFLFGTISLGSEPMAMLARGKEGNRAYRPMKIGEVIDGWELKEISAKSVRIQSGEIEATVIMNDPTANTPRVANRTTPRGGSAPQVSTVQASRRKAPVESNVNRPGAVAVPVVNPNPVFTTEDDVPPGFMIQRTPFGARLIPKPPPQP